MGKCSKYYRERKARRKLEAEDSFRHCFRCEHCGKKYGQHENGIKSTPSDICFAPHPSITINVFSENTSFPSIDFKTFQYITRAVFHQYPCSCHRRFITPCLAKRTRKMAVRPSAAGNASQIPVVPNRNGRIISAATNKMKPRNSVMPIDGAI